MRNNAMVTIIFVVIFSAAAAFAGAGGAFERFNETLPRTNAEIRRISCELEAAARELGAASKPSPVVFEAEGERTLDSGGEKKYETKNIELSKSFGALDGGGLIRRKNSVELKMRTEQALKSVEDITYEAYAGAVSCVTASCRRKLAEENLKIAENIIDAVTKKYEVALGSKMEIEQAALDYEVQVLKVIDAAAEAENRSAAFVIGNGLRDDADRNFSKFFNSGTDLTEEINVLSRAAEIPVESVETLYARALAGRRDLRAALYEVELLETAIEMEKRSGAPEFKLGVYRSVNDLDEAERGVRFGMSLPVFDFGRRSAAAEALRLKRRGFTAAAGAKSFYIEHLQRKILLEVTEKRNLCVSGREKLNRLSGDGLRRSSSLFAMAALGYAEGATSLFEYQNAKKNYFEFFEQLISAAAEHNLALMELRRACGVPPAENGDIMSGIMSELTAAQSR